MPERTYSEDEVAALIQRAAEMQAMGARQRERGGLTLAELEHVAREAGLDPALLRAAAAELDEPQRPASGRRSGRSATHVYAERWVAGPLTDEAWEMVVADLRHRYDTDLGKTMGSIHGVSAVEQVGRSVEWKHTSMAGIETRVLIQPRGEQVRVRASKRVGLAGGTTEAVFYGLGVALIAGVIAGPVAGSFFVGVVATLLTLLVAVPLIHRLDARWRAGKHAELEELADWVGATLQAGTPGRAGAAATTKSALAAPSAERLAVDDGAYGEHVAGHDRASESRRQKA